ncbi:hypothetical protein ABZT06_14715 [Streptomyces sp. NPDC005483]
MTAGTGTAELEGEHSGRSADELGHALRDADGHLLVPLDLAGN